MCESQIAAFYCRLSMSEAGSLFCSLVPIGPIVPTLLVAFCSHSIT